MRAIRLLRQQFLCKRDVEPPEVHELRRGIDLGLERGFRLAEHGGGDDGGPPGRGQQFGGPQEDGGAIVERPAGPLLAGADRGVGGLPHVLRSGLLKIREHMGVLVRHHAPLGGAGADLPAADDDRDVDGLGRHLLQAAFQLGASRCARSVGEVGVVLWAGHTAAAGKYVRHERFLVR